MYALTHIATPIPMPAFALDFEHSHYFCFEFILVVKASLDCVTEVTRSLALVRASQKFKLVFVLSI